MLDVFDDQRQNRKEDNDHNDVLDMAVDTRDGLSEKVSCQSHAGDPANPSGDVEQGKTPVLHLRNTSDNGCKRAREWHEAGQNDRDAPVLLIEGLRLQQMIPPEEPGLG